MKKTVVLVFFYLLFLPALLFATDTIQITVLYTSCNKGYFLPYKIHEASFFSSMKFNVGDRYGGYAAIAHYIKKVRNELKNKKGIFLLVDTGNSLIGSSEANFFNGKASIEFMNKMKYDAVTVGNLDWNIGAERIEQMTKQANFAMLGANMFIKNTDKHPDYIKPYKIIDIENLKIAVVGYAQDTIRGWLDIEKVKGLELRPQIPVLRKYVVELKKQGVDFIIFVDHADGDEYKKIIANVDGIDVLIESASEWATTWNTGFSKDFYLKEADKIKNTVVFHEVDSHFAVGRADIIFDKTNKKIVDYNSSRFFMNLNEVEQDEEIEKFVDKYASVYFDVVGNKLQEVIGYAAADFTLEWNKQWNTPLSTLITDALREYTKSEVGLENRGGIRRHIKKGPIKIKDIDDVLPFGNKIVTFKILGEDLMKFDLLQYIVEYTDEKKGEGKSTPWIYISGLEITRNSKYMFITNITASEKKIELNKYYTFATNSFLYNSGYLQSKYCKNVKVWNVKTNEAVVEYIKKHTPISPVKRETGAHFEY